MSIIESRRLDAGQLRDLCERMGRLEAFAKEISARMGGLETAMPLEIKRREKEAMEIEKRMARIEAADPKWKPIRKRWPNLSSHPKALEAFERHVKALGGEPSRKHLIRKSKAFDTSRHYMRPAIEAMGYSRQEAQAYMWFFQQADLATFEKDKGIIVHVHP